ncbi:hypothetical protein FOA52_014897 [Chlamydomonas sp. UWO 241]|nr:hypothetical protein FOA52_014897 [Chlamydomonas sp. UWO 241]
MFACLVQFVFTIPAYSQFTVGGVRFSDKTFAYLSGLQLLFAGGPSTLLAGGAGLVAGALYRCTGLRRLRLPRVVCSFFARTLGVLLQDRPAGPAQPPHGTPAAAAAAAAAAGSSGARRAGPGQQAARAAAAAVPPPPEELITQLTEMGFGRAQAVQALQATDNDVDMSVSLLVN